MAKRVPNTSWLILFLILAMAKGTWTCQEPPTGFFLTRENLDDDIVMSIASDPPGDHWSNWSVKGVLTENPILSNLWESFRMNHSRRFWNLVVTKGISIPESVEVGYMLDIELEIECVDAKGGQPMSYPVKVGVMREDLLEKIFITVPETTPILTVIHSERDHQPSSSAPVKYKHILLPELNVSSVFLKLDTDTGDVILRKALDYESGPRVLWFLFLKEAKESQLRYMRIEIGNMNDNAPEFYLNDECRDVSRCLVNGYFYTLDKTDELIGDNESRIHAIDLDGDPIDYSIVKATPQQNFITINKRTGELSATRPKSGVSSHYNLEVKASDGFHETFVTVVIAVEKLKPLDLFLKDLIFSRPNVDYAQKQTAKLPVTTLPAPVRTDLLTTPTTEIKPLDMFMKDSVYDIQRTPDFAKKETAKPTTTPLHAPGSTDQLTTSNSTLMNPIDRLTKDLAFPLLTTDYAKKDTMKLEVTPLAVSGGTDQVTTFNANSKEPRKALVPKEYDGYLNHSIQELVNPPYSNEIFGKIHGKAPKDGAFYNSDYPFLQNNTNYTNEETSKPEVTQLPAPDSVDQLTTFNTNSTEINPFDMFRTDFEFLQHSTDYAKKETAKLEVTPSAVSGVTDQLTTSNTNSKEPRKAFVPREYDGYLNHSIQELVNPPSTSSDEIFGKTHGKDPEHGALNTSDFEFLGHTIDDANKEAVKPEVTPLSPSGSADQLTTSNAKSKKPRKELIFKEYDGHLNDPIQELLNPPSTSSDKLLRKIYGKNPEHGAFNMSESEIGVFNGSDPIDGEMNASRWRNWSFYITTQGVVGANATELNGTFSGIKTYLIELCANLTLIVEEGFMNISLLDKHGSEMEVSEADEICNSFSGEMPEFVEGNSFSNASSQFTNEVILGYLASIASVLFCYQL